MPQATACKDEQRSMARRARCWRVCSAVTQQVSLSEAAKVNIHAVFQKIQSGQLPDLGSSRLSRQGHHHGGFVYLDPGLLPVHHACSRRRKTDQLQATSQLHSDLIAAFVRGQVGDRP